MLLSFDGSFLEIRCDICGEVRKEPLKPYKDEYNEEVGAHKNYVSDRCPTCEAKGEKVRELFNMQFPIERDEEDDFLDEEEAEAEREAAEASKLEEEIAKDSGMMGVLSAEKAADRKTKIEKAKKLKTRGNARKEFAQKEKNARENLRALIKAVAPDRAQNNRGGKKK